MVHNAPLLPVVVAQARPVCRKQRECRVVTHWRVDVGLLVS